MAREVDCVWIMEAVLEAQTAFFVGGLGRSARVDLPLARDGRGRTYVPGTSLAGVLRERAVRLDASGGGNVKALFGFEDQRSQQGHASHLVVADAPITGVGAVPEVRDGVGIDRHSGAAHDEVLYTRETLPAGTRVPLRLVVEVAEGTEDGAAEAAEALLPALVASLKRDGLVLGAGSTRGLGRFAIEGNVQTFRLRLASWPHAQWWWRWRSGFVDDLAAHPPPTDAAWPEDPDEVCLRHLWRYEIRWKPVGPLLVAAGGEGSAADRVPLQTKTAQGWQAVLPGASLKGTLRAHAERILRTLRGTNADVGGDSGGNRAIAQRQFDPLVNAAFGWAEPAGEGGSAKRARGAIGLADCHHREACDEPTAAWVEDDMPKRQKATGYRRRTRNAVDRWTGGAMDTALFTLVVPAWEASSEDEETLWEAMVVDLDLKRLSEDGRSQIQALLWILLRDLAAGRIPIGFGTHRGMGAIEIESIQVRAEGVELPAVPVSKGRLLVPADDRWTGLLEEWGKAWEAYVTSSS